MFVVSLGSLTSRRGKRSLRGRSRNYICRGR